MGVYIKEYRKPQTCGGCEFFKPWIHDRGDDSFCPLAVKETKASDRPTWCPIVEVKSHGRLIDADALLAEFEVDESSCDAHGQDFTFSFIRGEAYCTEWYYPQQRLMDAPTIIEAENPTQCSNSNTEESWTQIVCSKCGGKRFIVQGDIVVCDKCGARIESEGEDG